jgi:hypothetical protein
MAMPSDRGLGTSDFRPSRGSGRRKQRTSRIQRLARYECCNEANRRTTAILERNSA